MRVWEGLMYTDFIKKSTEHDLGVFTKIEMGQGCFGYIKGNLLPKIERDIIIGIPGKDDCSAKLKVLFRGLQNAIDIFLC